MKSYPSISKEIRSDVYIYCQAKYDGSLIRAEWSKKRGFYKFGTKKQLIDENVPIFGKSIKLIKDKYELDISDICKKQHWQDIICYFEFFGTNSFAGTHNIEDTFDVILFDADVYKHGLLEPANFKNIFKYLDTPKVLYEGHVNQTLIDAIRNSTLDGMPFEGVICKGKNDKKTKQPIMFKIKSLAWLNALKEKCKGDDKLFEHLA